MKRIIITILAIVLMLSLATFVFANDNLRVEKKADIENVVGTTAEEIVKDVEELEDEIVEDLDEIKSSDMLISPNSTLISTDESSEEIPEESNVAIIASATDEDDVFITEDNIDISGRRIDGNLFLLGDNIVVKQVVVTGDTFLLGKNIDVTNLFVSNSIYVLGQNLVMNNVSAKDIYSLGQSFEVKNSASIERNFNFLGEKINLEGATIGRDLNFYGNISDIKASVVERAFNYRSPNEATISDDSEIAEVNKTIIDQAEIEIEEKATPAEQFKDLLFSFVMMWIAGIFMLLVLSKVEGQEKYEKPVGRIVAEFFIGLIIGVVLLIVGIMAMIFTAGITVALVFVIWTLLFVAFIFAGVGAAHSFARATTKSYDGKKVFWLAFAIYTVYSVLKLVPVAKVILPLVFFVIGSGHNTMEFCKLLTKKFERKEPIAKEVSKVAVEPPTETHAIEHEIVEPEVKEDAEESEEKEEE